MDDTTRSRAPHATRQRDLWSTLASVLRRKGIALATLVLACATGYAVLPTTGLDGGQADNARAPHAFHAFRPAALPPPNEPAASLEIAPTASTARSAQDTRFRTAARNRLRLLTWNVRMGRNRAGTLNVDAQVQQMADAGADVMALQEVTITPEGDLPALYESKLEALTGRTWHAVWAPAPRPATTTAEGNLLLTAAPIVASSTLPIDSAPWDPKWLDTKRSAAHAAIAFNGATLNVIGTHLAVSSTHRRQQLGKLLAWVERMSPPKLVGGDFNMVEGSAEYMRMAEAFVDVWSALAPGGAGFTKDVRNTADGRPGRIDYWWQERDHSRARATAIRVLTTTRSDHYAVVVDVEIR